MDNEKTQEMTLEEIANQVLNQVKESDMDSPENWGKARKYVEEKVTELVILDVKEQKEVDSIRAMVGKTANAMQGTIVVASTISAEDVEAKAKEVSVGYGEKKSKIKKEITEYITAAEKDAVQRYYKAEPVPTESDRGVAADIVKDYNNDSNNGLTKGKDFMAQLEAHIENETVKALPYILALKELEPTVDITPYLHRIKPEMAVIKAEADDIRKAKEYFEMYTLIERSYTAGLTTSERIYIKRRIHELGGNANDLVFKNPVA